MFEPLREGIIKAIASASSRDDAALALARWKSDNAGDAALTQSIYECSAQADLGGQAFVRLVEVGEDLRHLARIAREVFALADNGRPAFLQLPFEEAVAFWRERGGSLDNFVRDMNEGAVSLGVEPTSPGYLETVYRTNVASAYGAGRFRQLSDPLIVAARPWRQYRTANDSRVRPAHAALDGLTFPAQGSAWQEIAPPNGFNCRCAMIALSDDAARQAAKTDSVPAEGLPDEGFRGPPTAEIPE